MVVVFLLYFFQNVLFWIHFCCFHIKCCKLGIFSLKVIWFFLFRSIILKPFEFLFLGLFLNSKTFFFYLFLYFHIFLRIWAFSIKCKRIIFFFWALFNEFLFYFAPILKIIVIKAQFRYLIDFVQAWVKKQISLFQNLKFNIRCLDPIRCWFRPWHWVFRIMSIMRVSVNFKLGSFLRSHRIMIKFIFLSDWAVNSVGFDFVVHSFTFKVFHHRFICFFKIMFVKTFAHIFR